LRQKNRKKPTVTDVLVEKFVGGKSSLTLEQVAKVANRQMGRERPFDISAECNANA